MATNFAANEVRATFVHPVNRRIFVSADDSVLVFSAQGALEKTITDVYGAADIDADPTGRVWVAATNAGRFAIIDPDTLTRTDSAATGMPVNRSIAATAGAVWFTTTGGLARYDVAAGTTTVRGAVIEPFGSLLEVPGAPDRLLTYGAYSLALIDIAAVPARVVRTGDYRVSGVQHVAISGDGAKLITATGAPYEFPQVDMATLTPDGTVYPGEHYPNGIAYAPAHGGIVAGTTASTGKIFVSSFGAPASTHIFQLTGDIVPGSVGIVPNGTRVFAVTQQGATYSLQLFPLAPTITAVAPSSVVADVPTTVTVTGTGFGRATAATVGGVTATATSRSTTQVVVDIPAGVPAGSHALKVSTPFGVAESTITVEANRGAVLSGTVRSAGSVRAGVTLTLTGGAGPAIPTTSGTDGTYGFPPVPYGRAYTLTVHDPAGAGPDLTLPGIELVPNQTRVLDIDLSMPPAAAGAEVSRVQLPSGAARQMVADPASNLVFASVGDEVVAIDRDGRLRARVQSQWGAQGLALDGSTLYVNLRSAGTISVIDTTTLTVKGTIPTGRPTNGELAFAAGKLFFAAGNESWVPLIALDPITRVEATVQGSWYSARLTAVQGSTTRFVASELGLSDARSYVVDGATLSVVAPGGTSGAPGPVVASEPDHLAWTVDGIQRRFPDLTPDGVRYPSNSWTSVAYGAGQGGVLAFGRNIARKGTPKTVNQLPDEPVAMAVAPEGDRVFYATAGGQLVTWDLAPHVKGMSGTSSASVTGDGLASATAVTIDGQATTFTVNGTVSLQVRVPTLAPGSHQLVVTTPWGPSAPFTFVIAPPPTTTTTTSTTTTTMATTTTRAPTTTATATTAPTTATTTMATTTTAPVTTTR